MSLASPVAAGAADPRIQDSPVAEAHRLVEALDQIVQFRNRFVGANLVDDLVRDGHHRARIVRQRRLGHQDQRLAIAQPVDDFRRGLAPWEFAEVLLDVLDFEGTGLQGVLLDQILHRTLIIQGRTVRTVPGVLLCSGAECKVQEVPPRVHCTHLWNSTHCTHYCLVSREVSQLCSGLERARPSAVR